MSDHEASPPLVSPTDMPVPLLADRSFLPSKSLVQAVIFTPTFLTILYLILRFTPTKPNWSEILGFASLDVLFAGLLSIGLGAVYLNLRKRS